MGVLKEPFPDESSVIIRFDKNGFWINGQLFDESLFDLVTDSDTPEWPTQPTTYEKTFLSIKPGQLKKYPQIHA